MNRKRGFTLIEVLATVAIVGLSLALLFQLFGQGLRSTLRAEAVSQAAVYARTVMETALIVPNPENAAGSGDLPGGLRYRVEVSPLERFEDDSLYRLTVQVEGDSGGRVRLSTVRSYYERDE